MSGIYSKAKPHLDLIYDATVQAGMPDPSLEGGWSELVRQQVAAENDFTDPGSAYSIARDMKSKLDAFYSFRKQGATWRDIYGMAATAYFLGDSQARSLIGQYGIHFDQFKKGIPGEIRKIIDASRMSIFWDFNNWNWFEKNYKAPSRWYLYALGLGAIVLLLKKKKK